MKALLKQQMDASDRVSDARAFDGRKKLLRILFIHHDMQVVDRCLRELRRTRFTASWKVVTKPEQFVDRLRSGNYDLVISEYPLAIWKGKQLLDLMQQLKKSVPLIFLVCDLKRETAAGLMMEGASDFVAMNSITHLPVAVLRALEEKALRDDRDRAKEELRRSEARYRALAGNLSYGIFHCNSFGRFIDVNHALVAILDYETKDELMAVNLMSDLILNTGKLTQLLGQTDELDPLEVEWKQKNGKAVTVHLSGQRVTGGTDTYEVIVEDITKQRALEDHLRRLAASDPLTGLANYRHLIEVLDMEIKRSKRSGRQFALMILDVDGLKRINDQYGHVTGNRALCRVADALIMCCRGIDSAARFGGDEFAVVLPEIGKEAANSVALRISAAIENDGKGPNLSVSMGVAVYPEDGDKIECLVRLADTAMYAIKREKPAAAVHFSQHLRAEVVAMPASAN
jgi:diguanylate cyclase (GGDEF)-like protein/PAS domain S-box-containing protein